MSELTTGEKEFIAYIWQMVSYWKTTATDQDRMEGLAFSILVALDGCSMLPAQAISRKVLECGYLHEIFHGQKPAGA